MAIPDARELLQAIAMGMSCPDRVAGWLTLGDAVWLALRRAETAEPNFFALLSPAELRAIHDAENARALRLYPERFTEILDPEEREIDDWVEYLKSGE